MKLYHRSVCEAKSSTYRLRCYTPVVSDIHWGFGKYPLPISGGGGGGGEHIVYLGYQRAVTLHPFCS